MGKLKAWLWEHCFSLLCTISRVSIIPSKNYYDGLLILWNSVLIGIPWNFTEFRSLNPTEFKNFIKFRRNSIVRNSAGHSNTPRSRKRILNSGFVILYLLSTFLHVNLWKQKQKQITLVLTNTLTVALQGIDHSASRKWLKLPYLPAVASVNG